MLESVGPGGERGAKEIAIYILFSPGLNCGRVTSLCNCSGGHNRLRSCRLTSTAEMGGYCYANYVGEGERGWVFFYVSSLEWFF